MDPKNFVRKLYHLLAGLVPPAVYLFVESKPTMLAISAAFLAVVLAFEFYRLRHPRFNEFVLTRLPVGLKSGERNRVASHGHIVVAFFLVVLFAHRPVAIAAMAFLAFGDPAGAVVGMRWGRHKIGRGPKSYEGTAACFLACLAAGVALSLCLRADVSVALPVWIVTVGAAVATLTELWHWKLDDNFAIPVASAAVMEALWLLTRS